jgi:hypothetical protein
MRPTTSRRSFLQIGLQAGSATLLAAGATSRRSEAIASEGLPVSEDKPDRTLWLKHVERVSNPVLEALSKRELRLKMPVEAAAGHEEERRTGTHLEAFARLLSGLAPWLELEPSAGESAGETALRQRYRAWAQMAIESTVDRGSPDYMRFGESGQTLVDSSFLGLALLRAPKALVYSMSAVTRTRLIAALEAERKITPPQSNWLLFAALNEVVLRCLGAEWDRDRVGDALNKHKSWYLGDGTYGDGPRFHADFYNSFVIHPYLLALMDVLRDESSRPEWASLAEVVTERARRYAAIQERMISPGGEFPVLGRSIAYRGGAFHLLADVARRRMLPEGVAPAAVRCALTAVLERTLTPAGTFSKDGWLQIGLAGHQPSLGETYISTGSLYLCAASWLPLGLPPTDAFWAARAAAWTQKRIWAGEDALADHALGS